MERVSRIGANTTPTRRRPEYAAPAADRALDILEHLAASPQPRGINELARDLGIPVNTVYRLLQRLDERGYVACDDNGYQVTSRLFTLGMGLAARFNLRGKARPHLEALCRATGLTCQLHTWDRGMMLVADCVVPEHDFWLEIRLGARLHAHPNAFGKAVLAFLPEADREAVLAATLPALTPATVTSATALRRQCKAITQSGLAYDFEEYITGIVCVGAPIFGADGRVLAGVGVTGFASAVDPDLHRHDRPVLEAAAAITLALGGTDTPYQPWRQRLTPA